MTRSLSTRPIRYAGAALAAMLLLALAHGARPSGAGGPPAAPASPPAEQTPTAVAQKLAESRAQFPDTPVGAQLAWVVGVLNEDAGSLTEEDLTAHLTPEFLGALSSEQLIPIVQQFAEPGPFAFEGFSRPPTATQGTALLTGADGAFFVMPLAIEASMPHRITGFNLAPVPAPAGVKLRPWTDAGAVPGYRGGLFDIGGRRLYLNCQGMDGPTVVFESGVGNDGSGWFAVESAVAGFTRVCSYDRANTVGGASDPAPTPRTGEDVVADLHALLAVAGVPGPYVLVGHSLGGLFARQYAGSHLDDVAGLVLVDSAHEEQDIRYAALLPADLQEVLQQLLEGEAALEGIDQPATYAQLRAVRAAAPLRPMPLVVLAAGVPADASLFPPGWPVAALQALDQELQADLAGLLPGGRLVIAEQSGHYIHQGEPDLVVAAIRDVVEAVRR
jgi:pimeloyl-ACP methyl ester carboxylesterase